MKIAIFSSWLNEVLKPNQVLAHNIADYLTAKKVTIVTGASNGIPALVAEKGFRQGATTIGYFPFANEENYRNYSPNENIHSIEFYTSTFFVSGYSARSLKMIQSVDAGLILNGRIGTLSEFSIAVEEGLPLAVIENTGGIADELRRLAKVANKQFKNSEVIFEKDYKKAIDSLIQNYLQPRQASLKALKQISPPTPKNAPASAPDVS